MKIIRKVFPSIFIIFFYLAGHGQLKFYVGTFTSGGAEGIYLCSLNTTTGDLSLEQTFKGIDNPNYLKVTNNRKLLYTVTRTSGNAGKENGNIQAYKIASNGSLEFLNQQSSNGSDPCYVDISPDDKYVAIATYGGGTTSLYKITNEGGLSTATNTIINNGYGPHPRQTKPHAHSIRFSPDGKQLFSADLGTDNLNIYTLKNGKIKPAKQPFIKIPPGSGPRHFVFHPYANIIYVINELISTVCVLEKKGKTWEIIQTVNTLPDDFKDTNYCSDIHISNDGKFVYGSNRGHNSIVVFKTNPLSKKLEFLTTVSTNGKWPRNFRITPDGKFLLAANEHTGNIVVYKINHETGIPEYTGKELEIPSPVCIEFL